MAFLPEYFNPLSSSPPKVIKTPWGNLEPHVDIFPIIYLIFIYGLVYILPYGRDIIGMSWFDWFRTEDGPLEWLQFLCFLGAFICSSLVVWQRRFTGITRTWIIWLLLAILCFFVHFIPIAKKMF